MLFLILSTLSFILLSAIWYHYVRSVGNIPGPRAIPIIGNAFHFLKNPKDMFCYLMYELPKLGRVIRIWGFHESMVIIQRAEDFEKLLKGSLNPEKSESYRFLKIWVGNSLITAKGERLQVYKKIMPPAFHVNILHEFIPIFNRNAYKFTQKLAIEPNAKEGFDIVKKISPCVLDIIMESSLGTEINAQDNPNIPFVHAAEGILKLVKTRYISAVYRFDLIFRFSTLRTKMLQHVKVINEFAQKVIAERREYLKSINNTGSGPSVKRRGMAFIDTLLTVEDKYPEYLTPEDIRDNVGAFITGDEVLDELLDVFGDSGRSPCIEDLNRLKVLERCVKEALRLYPSATFFERNVNQDTQLADYMIPAGCDVMFNIFALHRDPKYFPDPEKFDPDRFLPENCANRNPFAYLPFSVGARYCIGQKFAVLEEKVVLSTILRKFRIEAAQSRDSVQLEVGMILLPSCGLRIRVFERESHPNLQVNKLNKQ